MTTVSSINLNKIYLLLLGSVFALFFASASYAQEPSASPESAEKKFNITFPVAELGNCDSLKSCKEYCSDPANKDACIAYAKQKGFYKESNSGEGNSRIRTAIEQAKTELGCSTEKECKEFCSQPANKDKCLAFAQKYGLSPLKQIKNLLEKASKILGCTSDDACKAFCQDPANFDKCAQFAKAAGIGGREIESSTGSGRIKEASNGGKFTPNSQSAFEHANERAKFCREYPDKCKNASSSGSLSKESIERKFEEDKKKLEIKLEKEKKELERKGERLKNEVENSFEERKRKMEQEMISIDDEIENEIEDAEEDKGGDDSDVKGASVSPSLAERVWHFFFK